MGYLIKSFGSSSKGNSILVGDILLDAGVSPNKIKARPRAVFITHRHQDHMKYIQQWQKRGIRCYSGEIENSAFGQRINVWDVVIIGNAKIQALPSLHDTENPLNFLIDIDNKRILYEVDNAKRIYEVEGVTHYIAECNWDEQSLKDNIGSGYVSGFEEPRLRSTHKSLEILVEELETMDKSRLEEIWLAHMSDRNLNKELAKRIIQERTGVLVRYA